jgi:hypothetical protein
MTRKFMDIFKPEILEIIQKYKKNYSREEMERCPICQGEFCGSDEPYLLLWVGSSQICIHTDCAIKDDGFDVLEKIKGSVVDDYDLIFHLPEQFDEIQNLSFHYEIWEGSLQYRGIFTF